MNEKLVKDKAIYVVGLLSAFLAFSTFKEELYNIKILLNNHSYSLLYFIVFFVILLSISVYLYALDYVKYSFGKYQNFILFRAIIPLANFFYSIAILFPLLVLLSVLISLSPFLTSVGNSKILLYFDIVGGIFIGVFSVINALFLTKKERKNEVATIEESKVSYLERALKLFNGHFYTETIVEASKVLELTLRKKLLEEKGLKTENFGMLQILRTAQENNLIEPETIKKIKELQILRNHAVHSAKSFSESEARIALDLTKEVMQNIEKTDSTKD
jgi:hypothetical protein